MPAFLGSILWRLGQTGTSFILFRIVRTNWSGLTQPHEALGFQCDACGRTFEARTHFTECRACGTIGEIRVATSKEKFKLLLTKQLTRP